MRLKGFNSHQIEHVSNSSIVINFNLAHLLKGRITKYASYRWLYYVAEPIPVIAEIAFAQL